MTLFMKRIMVFFCSVGSVTVNSHFLTLIPLVETSHKLSPTIQCSHINRTTPGEKSLPAEAFQLYKCTTLPAL